MKRSSRFDFAPWATLLVFFIQSSSFASMPEALYQSALQLTEQSILRKKEQARTGQGQALSSTALKTLYGRYYQIGDSWQVAAFEFNNNKMRMTEDPDHLEVKVGAGGM